MMIWTSTDGTVARRERNSRGRRWREILLTLLFNVLNQRDSPATKAAEERSAPTANNNDKYSSIKSVNSFVCKNSKYLSKFPIF